MLIYLLSDISLSRLSLNNQLFTVQFPGPIISSEYAKLMNYLLSLPCIIIINNGNKETKKIFLPLAALSFHCNTGAKLPKENLEQRGFKP